MKTLSVNGALNVMLLATMFVLSAFSPALHVPQDFFLLCLLLGTVVMNSRALVAALTNKLVLVAISWMLACTLIFVLDGDRYADNVQRIAQQMVGILCGAMLYFQNKRQGELRLTSLSVSIGLACCFAMEYVSKVAALPIISSELVRYVIAILGAYLIAQQSRSLWRAGLVSVVLMAVCLMVIDSKTFVLVFLFAFMWSTLAHRYKMGRLNMGGLLTQGSVFAVLLVIVAQIFYVVSPSRYEDIFGWQNSVSTVARAAIATSAIQAATDSPVFGYGPLGFNDMRVYTQYYEDSPLLEALIAEGATRSHAYVADNVEYSSGTHQMYLDLTVSYGVPMLVFVVAALLYALKQALASSSPIKLAVLSTTLVTGFSWQYSSTAYGMAGLFFAIVALADEPAARKRPSPNRKSFAV